MKRLENCLLKAIMLSLIALSQEQEEKQTRNAGYSAIQDVLADNFKFIALPTEQQQQQQIPNRANYGNENSKQYSKQTFYSQQPDYYQQQNLSPVQQQQQQQNVYQFQSLTNSNQHLNPHQNRIQMQLYSQVPSTTDITTTKHTNHQQQQQHQQHQQQQYYEPISYAALAKSQQQQQNQRQKQQHQQYSQFNQQQIQRNSPEYESISSSSSLTPFSAAKQPTSFEMSTAFIRRLGPQQQQRQQQSAAAAATFSPKQQSTTTQQAFSKPASTSTNDIQHTDFLPSYAFEANEASTTMNATCSEQEKVCCQPNQNPCQEFCCDNPLLSGTALKLVVG